MFDNLYDISTVSMTIFQPRRDNVSTFTVDKESLYQWANEVLILAAEMAFKGEGEYRCGEHCQFCRAKAECRERAKANLELAAYDFSESALLEQDEIATTRHSGSDIKEYCPQPGA